MEIRGSDPILLSVSTEYSKYCTVATTGAKGSCLMRNGFASAFTSSATASLTKPCKIHQW